MEKTQTAVNLKYVTRNFALPPTANYPACIRSDKTTRASKIFFFFFGQFIFGCFHHEYNHHYYNVKNKNNCTSHIGHYTCLSFYIFILLVSNRLLIMTYLHGHLHVYKVKKYKILNKYEIKNNGSCFKLIIKYLVFLFKEQTFNVVAMSYDSYKTPKAACW